MNGFQKTIAALSLTAFSLGVVGCTEEQVNIGTGIAIGAIIGASLADGSSHRDHRDYRDDHRRDDRGRPGRGPGRRGFNDFTRISQVVSSVSVSQEQTAAQNLVEKYSLSEEAALTLAAPLVSAKNGNIDALTSLGITKEDMLLMSQGKNPSASTLVVLSQKLSLSFGETHSLIQLMKMDVESALAAQ